MASNTNARSHIVIETRRVKKKRNQGDLGEITVTQEKLPEQNYR